MSFNFKKKALFSDEPEKVSKEKTKKEKKQEPQQSTMQPTSDSFNEFDLHPSVLACLGRLGYEKPTRIQQQTLKNCKGGQDLLCLSQTGSGKTLSFVLPIIDWIRKKQDEGQKIPFGIALIIGPTRQLCIQINQYFDRFRDAGVGQLSSLALYGGIDPMQQVLEIAKRPQVIVATPGRILDHLQNTKGFHLNNLKFLVLDEADKLLNKDFEEQFTALMAMLPTDRRALLFSATLTNKVQKLQRVSLRNPIRVQVSIKYQTTSSLQQYYMFVPSKMKDCYLIFLLNQDRARKTIIFAQTRLGAERIALTLLQLGFSAECLHGDMSQIQRIKSLQKFKAGEVKILVCTDVAARGIDISLVEFVVNYDLCDPKNYVHRVGRTARIGHAGKSVTIVTQYDVQAFKKIEERLGEQMEEYPCNPRQAQVFLQRLELTHQQVSRKMKRKREGFFQKAHQQ